MVVAQGALGDLDGFQIEGFCLAIAPLGTIEPRQVIEAGRDSRMGLP